MLSFFRGFAWVFWFLLLFVYCFGVAEEDLLPYAELLTLPFLEGKLALYLFEYTVSA